jgi:hypothetical protein
MKSMLKMVFGWERGLAVPLVCVHVSRCSQAEERRRTAARLSVDLGADHGHQCGMEVFELVLRAAKNIARGRGIRQRSDRRGLQRSAKRGLQRMEKRGGLRGDARGRRRQHMLLHVAIAIFAQRKPALWVVNRRAEVIDLGVTQLLKTTSARVAEEVG